MQIQERLWSEKKSVHHVPVLHKAGILGQGVEYSAGVLQEIGWAIKLLYVPLL